MQARAGEALSGRRVLVIEDEMLVAMEFESLLERQGCAVVGPASTVDRALSLLDHDQLDAALLDLNLNGEPATAVAVALRTRGVPFVLVTGYGEAQSSSEPELQDAPRVDKPTNRSTTTLWCVHWRELWTPGRRAESLLLGSGCIWSRRARTLSQRAL